MNMLVQLVDVGVELTDIIADGVYRLSLIVDLVIDDQ